MSTGKRKGIKMLVLFLSAVLVCSASSAAIQHQQPSTQVQEQEDNQHQLRVLPSGESTEPHKIENDSVMVTDRVARGDTLISKVNTSLFNDTTDLTAAQENNRVTASNPTSGEISNHTLQIQLLDSTANFSKITLDYRGGDGGIPGSLIQTNIAGAGIDTNADGQVERTLSVDDTTTTTNSQGLITTRFQSKIRAQPGDVLYVKYNDIKNPEKNSSDQVTISVNRTQTSANITYGPSGIGNLGNKLNLAITTSGNSERLSPLPATIETDPSGDYVYFVIKTGKIGNTQDNQISVALERLDQNGTVDDVLYHETATIVNRTASIELASNSSWDPADGPLVVSGTTTLAPGSTIWVKSEYRSRQSVQWLYYYKATVNEEYRFEVAVPPEDHSQGGSLSIGLNGSRSTLSSVSNISVA